LTIDPDLAPTGEALDDALATASLPEHQRDRFEGYVRGCLEYLQNNPHTPVTAHELHEHAPQIPASPENMGGHDRSLSVLAGLPGVSEPDDAPAWHYVGGADE
jgi:hypothetical protein